MERLSTAFHAGSGYGAAAVLASAAHDDALGKSAGKRKQLLSPLRRRKSDVTDSKSKRVHTVRVEAASAAPKTARGRRRASDSTLQTPQLSQAKSGQLLRGDTATGVARVGQKPLEARQRDTIQKLRASRPSTHAGRWGASSVRLLRSQAGSDERVGQGQLKVFQSMCSVSIEYCCEPAVVVVGTAAGVTATRDVTNHATVVFLSALRKSRQKEIGTISGPERVAYPVGDVQVHTVPSRLPRAYSWMTELHIN